MPLSEHEQRALDELAQRVAADDPQFGERVGRPKRPGMQRAVALVGVPIGLVLLVLFCMTTLVALGLASFLVLFFSLYRLWGLSSHRVHQGWEGVVGSTGKWRMGLPRRRHRS